MYAPFFTTFSYRFSILTTFDFPTPLRYICLHTCRALAAWRRQAKSLFCAVYLLLLLPACPTVLFWCSPVRLLEVVIELFTNATLLRSPFCLARLPLLVMFCCWWCLPCLYWFVWLPSRHSMFFCLPLRLNVSVALPQKRKRKENTATHMIKKLSLITHFRLICWLALGSVAHMRFIYVKSI